jgi:hypothetical protein
VGGIQLRYVKSNDYRSPIVRPTLEIIMYIEEASLITMWSLSVGSELLVSLRRSYSEYS